MKTTRVDLAPLGEPVGKVTFSVQGMSLSKRTMRTIKQNFFWAFVYNSALIPVARGADEMHRLMSSERAPQAMAAVMDMARRMGDGDTVLGMVRMMEMMGSMGGMMGGQPHQEQPPQEQK